MNEPQHYLHDTIEVILTGRVATRHREGRGRLSQLQETLHEITPCNLEQGSWKKWVNMNDLFTITNNNNTEENTDVDSTECEVLP